MSTRSAPVVLPVVQQHAEEAAHLRHVRSVLVRAPHVKLHQLARLDERIAAHLDGLAVAGDFGRTLCAAALEHPGVGEVFAAAVRALEEKDQQRVDRLVALVEAMPESARGLISAFGWVSAQFLQGTIKEFLGASNPYRRLVGLAACAMHRVDPGPMLDTAMSDAEVRLRARALRTAGECGRRDLLQGCSNRLGDEDSACGFWAAYSAVLLGNRGAALDRLASIFQAPGPHREQAMRLVLRALDPPRAHTLLRDFAQHDPANVRTLLQGAGIAGDPQYVPWLIKHMNDLKLARLAGESFTLITGADLAWLDLERRPPEGAEFGPTENPEDEGVDMDPDDSLPWPDPEKIQKWWAGNAHQFQSGVRFFMGSPPNREHCIDVLKNGYQRQRIAAAEYLCLLTPGTSLFNTAAPAWRQKRWLSRLP